MTAGAERIAAAAGGRRCAAAEAGGGGRGGEATFFGVGLRRALGGFCFGEQEPKAGIAVRGD